MALKKSQLYSTLWSACDALRGGMDASQYKDYVLVVLFLKYISDKVKTDPDTLIKVPEGCSFDDILALKNKDDIGEQMNKILEKIADENNLQGVITNADFADENKLGKGKELVKTVSNLIAVFDNENLDFSNNRAADDDLIGDAYEYLMRNFASQSGKSKGQFYTPAEVSRVMANVIGINKDERPMISIYDPTCGSGSLLLRARAEAHHDVSIDGQEKDLATIGMAKMSMIIHGVDDADLKHGDTLNDPLHKQNESELTTYDYVVANPPFSFKSWMKTAKKNDAYSRWAQGNDNIAPVPPSGCGDYAFLLHIIASLKSEGHGACILPHGVLFRGGAEGNIREFLVRKHLISGIIGLPSNLFYGTGIPACIIIIDKEHAYNSQGIFIIDAKEGFEKDGAKNRLREMDIRRIEDVWKKHEDIPHYARFVSFEEIESNGYNLNIPRYVTPEDTEILQDITAHIHGDIPAHDVEDVLAHYWKSCPSMPHQLFSPLGNGYYKTLQNDATELRNTISNNADYLQHSVQYRKSIRDFLDTVIPEMKALSLGFNPKEKIEKWGNKLLEQTSSQQLVDPYEVYQILRSYWDETMQDDCYLISRDGWKVVTSVEKKKPTYRDISCDLVPQDVLVNEYFKDRDMSIKEQEAKKEEIDTQIKELEEENPQELDDTLANIRKKVELVSQPAPLEDEETVLKEMLALFALKDKEAKTQQEQYIAQHKNIFKHFEKINKTAVGTRLKQIQLYEPLDTESVKLFTQYIGLNDALTEVKSTLKVLMSKMYNDVMEKYKTLTESEIQHLVVDSKWNAAFANRADTLINNVSSKMATDVLALVDRYANTLPEIDNRVNELRNKVNAHLAAMGIKL